MPDRDWKAYNAALVRRGEILLDFSAVKGWKGELDKMNEGKEGGQYEYPDSFIKLLAFVHAYLRLPYRQLEGFVRTLSRHVDGLKAPDYSSMAWRIQRLDVELDDDLVDSMEEVVLALDASGIKVANRGEWMRRRWRARRGFLKIHVAVDVKTKRILAMEVTKETVADGGRLKSLVEGASKRAKVARAIGDGAYDSKANFRYLARRGIEPAIKVRKDASGKAGGCMARKLVVREYLRDPKAWKRNHGYGQRWMAETAFSTFKRLFGEYASSVKFGHMVREMLIKASLYNLFTAMSPGI